MYCLLEQVSNYINTLLSGICLPIFLIYNLVLLNICFYLKCSDSIWILYHTAMARDPHQEYLLLLYLHVLFLYMSVVSAGEVVYNI